jgi:hypothetical protein
MKTQHRQLITKTLAGTAIVFGAWIAGAAPANANTNGTDPNPFGGLKCDCQQTAAPGSPALRGEIERGIQQGHSAWSPGLAPSTQPRGFHVGTLTNCVDGLGC